MKKKSLTVHVAELVKAAEQLKSVPRVGWLLKGKVKRAESVADHSYAVAMISMVLGDIFELDTLLMLRLSLLHDISESLVGDIQPEDLPKEKKHQLERRAFNVLTKDLPKSIQNLYRETFDDFQKETSEEARIVAQIDKLEMALQADQYRKEGYDDLNEFLATARRKVRDKRLIEMMSNILSHKR